MMDPELGDALVKRKSSWRLIDDDSSSSDENAGDTDVRDIASSDAAPVQWSMMITMHAGIPVDPVYAVNTMIMITVLPLQIPRMKWCINRI